MRLIVTGSTGFLGSRLLPLFVRAGFPIQCLVRHPEARGLLEGQGCNEWLGINLPIKAEQLLRLNENKDFCWTDAAEDFGCAPRDFAAGMSQELAELGVNVNNQ
jgi:nucleoside-diphosphate-sugar epimerase